HRVPEDLPARIEADEKRLRQVLLNLLGNAVKFTDRGEVALIVRAEPAAPRRTRLRLEVRDTGVGMTDREIERVFDPFEQAGDPLRRTGGTGLGLSISRQLVHSMDSEIEVESQAGHGSAFAFEIDVPLTDGPLPAGEPERAVIGYRGPRKSVLVV